MRFKTLRNGTGLDDIPIWIYVVEAQFLQIDAKASGLLLQNGDDFIESNEPPTLEVIGWRSLLLLGPFIFGFKSTGFDNLAEVAQVMLVLQASYWSERSLSRNRPRISSANS